MQIEGCNKCKSMNVCFILFQTFYTEHTIHDYSRNADKKYEISRQTHI